MGTDYESDSRPEVQTEYERRLDEAVAKTVLPDNPDMEKVESFVERVNRFAIMGELK